MESVVLFLFSLFAYAMNSSYFNLSVKSSLVSYLLSLAAAIETKKISDCVHCVCSFINDDAKCINAISVSASLFDLQRFLSRSLFPTRNYVN